MPTCFLAVGAVSPYRDTDGTTIVTASHENGKLAVAVEGTKKTVSVRLVPLKI